nr:hypothetical protein [Treponema sp.]
MRIFFRVAIIFLFALFLASCKQKAQNTSPIADCVVTPKVSPVEIYSDVEKNEKTNYELSVFTEPTQLSIIEQSGDLLKVKFSDGGSKKTGWISLKDVTLTKEIFDKTVNLVIDGDENAKILFEHSFYMFSNAEAVEKLTKLLADLHLKDRLQKENWEDDAALQNFVSLILPKFQKVTDFSPDTTNPLHILLPYANEEILFLFDDMSDYYDSDGRSCLMLATKFENIAAVKYLYKKIKANNFSGLTHKDNEGRALVNYIDNCKNDEIREMLALCRYDVPSLVSQCVEYLAQTQNDRELAAEALTEMSEDKQTILLTQQEFARGDTPIVLRQAQMFLPDGTTTEVNSCDTVEIVELLSDRYGEQPYNSLFEYDEYNPDSAQRYYTRYNYYLVRFKDKVGILSGSALAHDEITMGAHFYSSAELDGVKLYVNYKYIKHIFTNESEYFVDLYEYDLKTEQLRKLETGFAENEMHFESRPISLGNQDFMRNFTLVKSFPFKMNEQNYYFCAFSFNPFSWAPNRSLYHFYAVRDDGTAFLLGTFGNSEYVQHCAEVNSDFKASLDEDSALPELTMFEYGYKSRNWVTGEEEGPFTNTFKFKLNADLMQFYETGIEFEDYLPEF